MDTLFGLPAHPLLVHLPVVLLPLAAAGVVVMAITPAWHARFRWVVLVLGALGVLGAVLAASAGESLEDRVERVEGPPAQQRFDGHTEDGELAQTFALIFLVVLVLFVFVPWLLERRRARDQSGPSASTERWVRIAVSALAIAGAAGSVVTVVSAGHSGADAVWSVYDDDE